MEFIQEMLVEHNWVLKCWDGRYSTGIIAALTPANYQSEEIKEATEDGCSSSGEILGYFTKEGSWLPVVVGVDLSLDNVLKELNAKAEALTKSEELRTHVYDGFNRTLSARDGYFGLGKAIKNGDELLLKPNLPE